MRRRAADPLAERPGDRIGQAADRALAAAVRMRAEIEAEQAEVIRGIRQRREQRMAFAASERRLAKEIRAYHKLDQINERWQRRGRPQK